MPKTTVAPAVDWTCARCEVNVSWMPDAEAPGVAGDLDQGRRSALLPGCRRERAGEAALVGLDEASAEDRRKAETRARIDFEMNRRPESEDSRIAKSCHTSIKAVQQARVRLGMQSRRPA